MGDEPGPQKSHRERQAGRKFEKKKARTKVQDEGMTARQRNPRAFAIQSVNKMARKVRRYGIYIETNWIQIAQLYWYCIISSIFKSV